jgi:carbonic anhydrase/acetyltransferase-like protein (isoleucine patch superfamily)
MNAVVMDRVHVGDESIVGALAFVAADTVVPSRSVVVGNPAKVVKQVTDEMIAWKTEGTKIYQQLPEDCRRGLRPVEPLREVPENRRVQPGSYSTWNEQKSNS